MDQITDDDTVEKNKHKIFIKSRGGGRGGGENEIARLEQMKSCRMCIIMCVQKRTSA